MEKQKKKKNEWISSSAGPSAVEMSHVHTSAVLSRFNDRSSVCSCYFRKSTHFAIRYTVFKHLASLCKRCRRFRDKNPRASIMNFEEALSLPMHACRVLHRQADTCTGCYSCGKLLKFFQRLRFRQQSPNLGM